MVLCPTVVGRAIRGLRGRGVRRGARDKVTVEGRREGSWRGGPMNSRSLSTLFRIAPRVGQMAAGLAHEQQAHDHRGTHQVAESLHHVAPMFEF